MKYIRHIQKAINDDSTSIYFIREDGKAFGALYYFDDDKKNGYLNKLHVYPSIRKQGVGLKLQLMRENFFKRRGYKYTYLWTTKKSWMQKWYERRGYKYYNDHDDEENCIWMRKKL